ncbi:MAG: ATP-binding protein [Planctomycetota bacterium]
MTFDSSSLTAIVLRSLSEGVVVANPQGELIWTNDAARAILNTDPLGAATSEWQERFGVFHRDTVTPMQQHEFPLSRALAGEVVLNDMQFMRSPDRPDGAYLEVNASELRDADHGLIGAVAVFRDVTERERQSARFAALSALARAANRRLDIDSLLRVALTDFAALFNAELSALLWLQNGRGHAFNVAGVNAHGTSKADLAGVQPGTQINAGDTPFHALIGDAQPMFLTDLASGTTPFEQRLAAAGFTCCGVAPLVTESKLLGVVLFAQERRWATGLDDVRILSELGESLAVALRNALLFQELDQAYDRLREAHQQAADQERLRAMGQMASGIAHDLNNALSPVVTLSEVLASGLAPAERIPRYLESIRTAALDSRAIIERLRVFYRPGSDDEYGEVDVGELLTTVIDLSSPRWRAQAEADGSHIKVTSDVPDDLPPVHGSRSELRQALLNLIINATEAMPQGGTLSVSAENVSSGNRAMVEIRVSDTGVGMSPDVCKRAFEPYFTTRQSSGGTGLGMSIVWGVVQRHLGRISLESEVDRGTAVVIQLPVRQGGTTTSGRSAAAHPRLPLRSLNVLCVDDDARLRDLLQELLGLLGHTAVLVDGGAAACSMFDPAVHQLVITDLGMPAVNGHEVAAHVKRTSPSTPVILLTGWGNQIVDTGRHPANVNVVMGKPPSLSELDDAIATLFAPRN